jgi:hypothetical protein
VLPINNARAVSALTAKQPAGTLAAVLRPCEIRALIELVKLQQATLDGVILIGLDCPGTYEVTKYVEYHSKGGFDLNKYLTAGSNGSEATNGGPQLRQACRMCDQPISEGRHQPAPSGKKAHGIRSPSAGGLASGVSPTTAKTPQVVRQLCDWSIRRQVRQKLSAVVSGWIAMAVWQATSQPASVVITA